MSIARVTEISAESPKSFDDAVKQGIDRACGTLEQVKAAWIKEQKVMIHDGKIDSYRVDMKVTFVLKE